MRNVGKQKEDKDSDSKKEAPKKEESFLPINIKALAARVSPILGKIVPKFMYNWFERILHVKELNAFFAEHEDDDAQTFLDAAVEFLGIHPSYEGLGADAVEALKGQNVMFASNHPYGSGGEGLC